MQVLPTDPSPTRTVLTRTRLSSLAMGPALYPPRAMRRPSEIERQRDTVEEERCEEEGGRGAQGREVKSG